jgi:alkaline phosphatase
MTFQLQILHASDLEGGLDAIDNAANFAAVVGALEAAADQAGIASILLSAGDNYIPGPFFNAGGDFGLANTYEGAYNQFYNLIDVSVLDADADTNGDGFFDNDEIQAVIDAGDLAFEDVYVRDVNGDGVADYFEEIDTAGGRLDIAIMNALGFDASAVGNHEFDAGTEAFATIVGYDSEEGNDLSSGRFGTVNFLQEVDTPGALFPYLSANLDFSGDGSLAAFFTDEIRGSETFLSELAGARVNPADPAETGPDGRDAKLAPATIIERDGEQIGVVGATTQLVASITSVGGVAETSSNGTNDMAALAAVLQPVIDDLLATGLNKVILVSHLQQFALEQELAGLLNGVDVIVAGGSDTLNADAQDRLRDGDEADLPYPVIVEDAGGNSTAIVSTDGEYSYVGRLVVTFDDEGNIVPDSIDPAVSGAFATDDAGVVEVTGADSAQEAIDASEVASAVQDLTARVTGIVTALDGDIAGRSEVYLNGEREDVRTQETNFGNLTADANLAAARAADPAVLVSIKNGGGIRAPIGDLVLGEDGEAELTTTAANPLSGKEAGEVSELDIDNALRFDNGLVTVDLTPAELLIVLEHAVAATAEGATPGQFPQVGGIAFSFDPAGQAQVLGEGGAVVTPGGRIQTVVLLDEEGGIAQRLIANGEVLPDAPESIRVVTLNFLAGGGDGYPFPAFSDATDLGIGEQEALSDFLTAEFAEDGFDSADRAAGQDTRIQNLAVREDTLDREAPEATGALTITVAAEFQGEGVDGDAEGASEVVVHEDGRLYVTNGALDRIDVFDIESESLLFSGDLSGIPGYGGVQSVAVANGVVAVAIARDPVEARIDGEEVQLSRPGFVVLADAATGEFLSAVNVGNLPDMLTFNEDGTQLLVAGEGEFNEDTETADNPLGTISVIDTTDPTAPVAQVLDFTGFDGVRALAERFGVRLQDGVRLSRDVEPEYIAISPDGTTAFVSLQENNTIATVDLEAEAITGAFALGTVDFGTESRLDAKDDDAIDIRSFDDLAGLRMPDSIATYEVDGTTYVVTANEGDSRGFDEARVEDLIADGLLDPSVDTEGLERLEVSTIDGDTDGDGDIDVLTAFSSRSFSIFTEDGTLVFDSGSQFEEIIAATYPARFNDDDGETGQNRSDAKGPEPEALAIGEVDGQTYAFVGLERDSGIMVYDITDPTQVSFSNYIEPAFVDFTPEGEVARHAPETIAFIPADESTSGVAQIAVAYEVSGSTVVYDLAPTEGRLLFGTAGDDVIEGAGGGDTIISLSGDDSIEGGFGADTFVLLSSDAGVDTIADFAADDRLAVDDTFFGPFGSSEIEERMLTREEARLGLQSGALGYDVATGEVSIFGEVVADLTDGTVLTLDNVFLF